MGTRTPDPFPAREATGVIAPCHRVAEYGSDQALSHEYVYLHIRWVLVRTAREWVHRGSTRA